MKLKLLSFYFILYYSQKLTLPLAEATSIPSNFGLQGQCKGLRPVYDDHGNLVGYKGACDVDKWDGSSPSLNSLHHVDPNLMALNNETLSAHPSGKIKYGQPKDASLFDWLSPHHDIIRNHPQYRHAHMNHSHCIRKTKTGLFDFLGSLFNFGSHQKNYDQYNNFQDPYTSLDKGTRCLNSQYYNNNPLDVDKKYYDPYALHLAHRIHHIQNQFDSTESANKELLRKHLRKRYRQLHRHLDCHCHHESPQSKMLNIHHHPIEEHTMNMIAYPIAGQDASNLQLHSSIPFDTNMDMENEHMALMRMSNIAAQRAYDMNYFNDDPSAGNGALRMEMFHPVNPYISNSADYHNYDPEWNRLRVEKVIVIKRIKVPVVKKVSVPVPVPVPYPMPTSSNLMTGGDDQYQDYGANSSFSQVNASQPQYLGNDTFMIDSPESQLQSVQMNNIVRAISGAPCEPTDQAYIDSSYYPSMNQFAHQSYNYNSPASHCNMMNVPNLAMSAQTAIQPGLQLYPAPFMPRQPQYGHQYGVPLQNPHIHPINLQPQIHNSTHLIPPVAAPIMASQNQLQGPVLMNPNYKY